MKSFKIAASVILLSSASALAADLPSRKAPVAPLPPPQPMWTGFYVGLNAGGTWASNSAIRTVAGPVWSDPNFAASSTYAAISALGASTYLGGGNNGGFIGGGQIGYNWQFFNSFVVGLEADIQGIATSTSSSSTVTALSLGPLFTSRSILTTTVSASRNIDYIGTVRGRLGWLATPTLLAYGTGGLAYGGVTLNSAIWNSRSNGFQNPAFASANFSNTKVGWTAGGGLEWMFLPNWSAKVEYLYYDLGNVSANTAALTSVLTRTGNPYTLVAAQTSARLNGNIVRAGVNYHFNWGAAPVVAAF
jgi:outer membrane immunogenic protein